MKKLAVLFLVSLFCVSCSKYENGPSLTHHSAKKKLTAKWQLSSILLNANDTASDYFSQNLQIYPFNIYADWDKNYYIAISHPDGNLIAKSGLIINKQVTQLNFAMESMELYETLASSLFMHIPFLQQENDWVIKHLTKKELWIYTISGGVKSELHFDMISDYADY
ncbi:MAG: hypothetical protein PHR81_04605 [Bacteroidales bacterium]|jgi:hypothetical protein|nr:hypothetical protein [Bacteroidales bacterium]MDD4214072.1 hypothetical protein [Bacteroidales bacterium]